MNNNDELMHYGRKGMKWGEHIYGQVKTARTNRQRKKNLAKARKAKAEKYKTAEERQKALNSGKIKPKDMTDQELQSAINHMQLEQRYSQLNPKQVSLGKKYVKKVIDDVVVPSLTNTARQALEKELKKQLGLNVEDPNVSMKKKVAEMELNKRKIELDEFFEERKKKNQN